MITDKIIHTEISVHYKNATFLHVYKKKPFFVVFTISCLPSLWKFSAGIRAAESKSTLCKSEQKIK